MGSGNQHNMPALSLSLTESGNLYGRGVRRYLCPLQRHHSCHLLHIGNLIHCHNFISTAVTTQLLGQKLVYLSNKALCMLKLWEQVKMCSSNARATPECHHPLTSPSDFKSGQVGMSQTILSSCLARCNARMRGNKPSPWCFRWHWDGSLGGLQCNAM